MYIAMNRFRVIKGLEQDFETVWRSRESYLPSMRGFISFYLLRGAESEDHTLYSSHTLWASHADFEAWTKSEAFTRSHVRASDPNRKVMLKGHPQFEGFEVVLAETTPKPIAAE